MIFRKIFTRNIAMNFCKLQIMLENDSWRRLRSKHIKRASFMSKRSQYADKKLSLISTLILLPSLHLLLRWVANLISNCTRSAFQISIQEVEGIAKRTKRLLYDIRFKFLMSCSLHTNFRCTYCHSNENV